MAPKKIVQVQESKSVSNRDKGDKGEVHQEKNLDIFFSPQSKDSKGNKPRSSLTNLKPSAMDINKDNKEQEEITTKVLNESLQSILEEIKSEISKNSIEIRQEIKSDIFKLTEKFQVMEDRLKNVDFQIVSTNEEVNLLTSKIHYLENKIEDLEDRSRRKNLRFRNFEDSNKQENLEYMLHDYFKALGLKLDGHNEKFERCHRLHKPSNITSDTPRDIITCFHSFEFKEQVLKANREKRIKDGPYAHIIALPDLSYNTRNKRRMFSSGINILKQHNIRFRWSYPTKMIIQMDGKIESFDQPDKLKTWLQNKSLN
ncbi:Hypothetical predicted protein [Pelobates cultripes]|uniref:L1 transposable element RRM domain-containing protein n=1 Tax=Pelobates cultripes TaxID=61616 RepID=A0AAD1T6P8_PELCU|nr:Hypothetical predicted protein [Pelobates cultripes]